MLTLDYLIRFRGCMSDAKFRERAQLWPDPLTWVWLLGARVREYARADVEGILLLAISHCTHAKLQPFGKRPGEHWRSAQSMADETLFAFMGDLGQWLDAAASGELERAAARERQAAADVAEREAAASEARALELRREAEKDRERQSVEAAGKARAERRDAELERQREQELIDADTDRIEAPIPEETRMRLGMAEPIGVTLPPADESDER